MCSEFEESKSFSDEGSGLRERITSWLDGIKTYVENPKETLGYDPNAYSIDEWEDYLRAKNNNLTFTQFVKRRRWRISPKRVSGKYNDYLYALRDAQLLAKEFLSTDEMAYVKQLLTALEDMEAICLSLLSEFWKIRKHQTPEAYEAAKIAKNDALRKWRFACRWKFIVDGDVPQDIRNIIAEQIMHELRYEKRKWENRRSWNPDMEEFDVAKVRMYKDAVAFGAITPVGRL